MGGWIVGVVMALVAILGLFLASGAQDGTMEWVGMLLAIFGVGYCYALIVNNTGR
jgi:predicted exporter